MVNRTQALVLGFVALAWISLVVILALAPEVYDATLNLPPENRFWGALGLVVAIAALIVVLGIGVVRRWRWAFWLILVAFLIGGLARVPVSALQVAGLLPAQGPTWYTALQGAIGVIQVGIGLAMLVGYRKAGVWGAF